MAKKVKPDYYMNDLMNECIQRFNDTFSYTLDTQDYVPAAVSDKVLLFIRKEYLKAFKRLKKCDKAFHRVKFPMSKKEMFEKYGKRRPLIVQEQPTDNLPVEAPSAEVVEHGE